jgi:AraC-like DNA-binding protein
MGDERLADCAVSIAPGRRDFIDGRLEMPASQLYLGMKIISDEVGAAVPHGILFLEHAVDLICVALIRSHSGLIFNVAPQRGLPLWQVKRVTAYMQERLGNDITLQELADIACKSRFHFCTAFRVATGVTPYDYLTQLRMRAACTLLRSETLQVGDVAISVGYRSVSAFSTAFRRYSGTSPREFRNARATNGYLLRVTV